MVFPDLTRDRSVFKSPPIIQFTTLLSCKKVEIVDKHFVIQLKRTLCCVVTWEIHIKNVNFTNVCV